MMVHERSSGLRIPAVVPRLKGIRGIPGLRRSSKEGVQLSATPNTSNEITSATGTSSPAITNNKPTTQIPHLHLGAQAPPRATKSAPKQSPPRATHHTNTNTNSNTAATNAARAVPPLPKPVHKHHNQPRQHHHQQPLSTHSNTHSSHPSPVKAVQSPGAKMGYPTTPTLKSMSRPASMLSESSSVPLTGLNTPTTTHEAEPSHSETAPQLQTSMLGQRLSSTCTEDSVITVTPPPKNDVLPLNFPLEPQTAAQLASRQGSQNESSPQLEIPLSMRRQHSEALRRRAQSAREQLDNKIARLTSELHSMQSRCDNLSTRSDSFISAGPKRATVPNLAFNRAMLVVREETREGAAEIDYRKDAEMLALMHKKQKQAELVDS